MLGHGKCSAAALLLAGSLALGACGDDGSDAGADASRASGAAARCGSVPTRMPADPDGVLAELPRDVRAGYNLYPETVRASAWADWKPRHTGPYKITFSPGNVSTPYVQAMLSTIKRLDAQSREVEQVVVQNSNNDPQTQIQQLRQAIRQKADLLIVLPLSSTSVEPVFEAAGKAGIPVIVPLNPAGSRYVVGIAGNNPLEGAAIARGLASALGGKGDVLAVHGIPGVPADAQVFAGAKLVLDGCPEIETVGEITGQFQPAVAKGETLKFLASHPQPIEGALQTGGMAGAVIQAFQQSGRKVPTVGDVRGTPGALAYWSEHKGSYKGVASGQGPAEITTATWKVALGMLAGRGIELTDISHPPAMITDASLDQWVEPDWTVASIGYAEAPTGAYDQPRFLDAFFAKPATR